MKTHQWINSLLRRNHLIASMVASMGLCSFSLYQAKPWVVPDASVKKTNPVKADAESLKDGKELWGKHCASCHGKAGAGDGSKAAELETEMQNFSTDLVQKQSDGSLFYKISEGRKEMPTFKKKIPDDADVWSLVNYIRTLKK